MRKSKKRNTTKEFIEFLHKNNIPLIIISAGVGNFIETFFKYNNCYYDNVYMSSNKIIFKNRIAVGVEENIIHSLNKNEISLPESVSKKIVDRNGVVLLGDQISDLNMVHDSKHEFVINVGFQANDCPLEIMTSNFDIVCEKDDDYNKVKDILF